MKILRITIISLMIILFLKVELVHAERNKKTLQDYTVFIDPGHGGYDGGTKGNGLVEKDLNLLIALYLRDYLEQAGINVLMTRTEDVDFVVPGAGSKKKRDLDHRINMINNSDCNLYISLHMNALPDPRWSGAQVFYNDNFNENKALAECIQQSITDVLQNTHRKAKTVSTLYLMKMVKKPGVLIEAGFLSNPQEADLLKQPIYQDKVAFAIYLGIINCINHVESLAN